MRTVLIYLGISALDALFIGALALAFGAAVQTCLMLMAAALVGCFGILCVNHAHPQECE